MSRILLVIDSYISNLERAFFCEKLIVQLRENFPEYKILLINKSKESFNVEKKVDYYFNFGDSFMVGMPPDILLNNGAYSKPYIFFGSTIGTLENWMPLVGITDHVAGIYNSFVLSAKIANTLGFEKVFKFEFDTIFDEKELKQLKGEIESFEDYILYGIRHEGKWTRLDLIDTHMVGYSCKIFDGFELVRNDEEYWELCSKVEYWGKWIEYLIPAILNYQKNKFNISGTSVEGNLREYYKNTKFDVVNSPGGWTEKWKEIPMIGKISLDSGETELSDTVCIFYLNKDFDEVNVDFKIFRDDEVIHHRNKILGLNFWSYEELKIEGELKVISEYTTSCGTHKKMEYKITKEDIPNLRYRILKS